VSGGAGAGPGSSGTGAAPRTKPGAVTGNGSTAGVPGGTTRRAVTGKGSTAGRRIWDLGAGDAETVLAEARKALFVMVGFLALLWIIQIVNWADHYRLTFEYGIRPRDLGSLPDIVTAPFLHFSWAHIEGNSGPLFIFGLLAAYRGVTKFLGVTVLVILTSGFAAWLFESHGSVGAGASGVVFGYFGYIMVRGFFDRHAIDMLLGAVMALCFAYQFTVLLPQAGIGWQAHIGGLVGGVAAGWVFRDRPAKAGPRTRARRPKPASPADGPRADLHKQLDDLGL
jgi:membrane associated rhomboid family serine protease